MASTASAAIPTETARRLNRQLIKITRFFETRDDRRRDLVQDAWIKLLKRSKGDPEWLDTLSTSYLAKVLKHLRFDGWRRDQRSAVLDDDKDVEDLSCHSTQARIERNPLPRNGRSMHSLEELLGWLGLRDDETELLVDHAVYGYDLSEIAARSGTAPATVRKRYERTRRKAGKALLAKGGEPLTW